MATLKNTSPALKTPSPTRPSTTRMTPMLMMIMLSVVNRLARKMPPSVRLVTSTTSLPSPRLRRSSASASVSGMVV